MDLAAAATPTILPGKINYAYLLKNYTYNA
jgi:hypothetical protein